MSFKRSQAVIVYSDGRERCTGTAAGLREYDTRRKDMGLRQEKRCAICKYGGFLSFDHEAGRGMGGSKRDDRILHDDGTWRNAALCLDCNSKKGSRPYHWVGAEYLPVPSKRHQEPTEAL